tara:strand:+ start:477 stop:668 length:192 start_codon:yes stop_codon:yes gene_type:complete
VIEKYFIMETYMGFLSFLALLVIAYLVWRINDQIPDLNYRLSEIQRNISVVQRQQMKESHEDE